jgi:serine/threonine protein kinase
MLPRRYKVDERQSPIIGPSNSILFATNNQERPVAIKSFGRREAWERECRTLIKLKSPCIVEILEVLTIQHEQNNDQVKYVTVMERLDQNLHYYLKRNSNHGSIARDILKCLEWCHGNGIAFCDLKPSNIMYDTEQCKLIDFEASRTIDEECVGVITPRYCPPEVARATTYGLEGANGVVATASVDLWSLGCVLFVSDALFSVL